MSRSGSCDNNKKIQIKLLDLNVFLQMTRFFRKFAVKKNSLGNDAVYVTIKLRTELISGWRKTIGGGSMRCQAKECA
jgi:hypothetical protein